MNKRIRLQVFAAFVLLTTFSFAQPTYEWSYSDGTASSDGGYDVHIDNAGNNYMLVARYNATSIPSARMYKKDPAGNLLMMKTLTSNLGVRFFEMTTDASGNIYLTGEFEGTTDLDPNSGVESATSQGDSDSFILKLTASGAFDWVKTFGGSDRDQPRSIQVAADGSVYTVGSFWGTVDFDPGAGVASLSSEGNSDVFIQKLDNNGDFLWVKQLGGAGYDTGVSLILDELGNPIVTGAVQSTVDLDPGVGTVSYTSNGFKDVFILKLNTSGDYIWSKTIGGVNSDTSRDININSAGDIVVTGEFRGTVDFDPNAGVSELTSIGSPYDCFVLQLDASGNYLWAKNFGGVGGHGSGAGIAIDADDNVYITGDFDEACDFDPGAGEYILDVPDEDYFVVKLDVTGDFVWAFNSGGLVPANGESIAVDANNNVLVVGSFRGIRDFDPGTGEHTMTSNGGFDYYQLMLSQACITTTITPDVTSLTAISDECSVSTLVAPTASTNCGEVITGTHDATLPITTTTTITWTYDDGNGNTSTQTQEVIIDDVTSPVADVATLSDIIAECEVTSLTAPTATDNCTGAITGTNNATLPITTTTTITWTYDDGNGNTTTQTQEVIIDDVTSPVADVAALSDITAECEVTSLTAPTATDNCTGAITGTHDATFPIATTTTITWTYDDGNGNTSTQTQEVIIDDVTSPVADVAALSDIIAECEVTSLTAPTATDNCTGAITGTNNATLPITTTTTITWTYDDGNGNTTTQTQEVIIDDVTSPVADVAALSDITAECEVTSLTAPTATDNCTGAITGTHNATLPITTSTTITWTYDDGNGNTSVQTQDIVIASIDNTITQEDALTLTANASGYSYQWLDCNNGNTPINGETNQTFVATDNGSYAVEIDNGTCMVISDCIQVTSVGIKDNVFNTIRVYPNPTNGQITISSESEFIKVIVMDALGKKVKEKSLDSVSSYTVELPEEPGIYFVSVKVKGNVYTTRVVKM
ncbi:hypothetical protein GCM10009118_00210 [Wandonia haliotis]|uniref:Secretion system C-terminal sorting domain-containing protein n=1 Tax=Wandonia haliotis TaxID=574963 RepID=A0ABN1MK53_9FLAO